MTRTALYVGNLPFSASNEQLRDLFSLYGPLSVAFVQGRNFAYVDVDTSFAEAAISALDGHMLGNRMILVKVADYTEPRSLAV